MSSEFPVAGDGLEEGPAIAIAETIRGAYQAAFGHQPAKIDVVGDDAIVVAVLRGVFDEEERSAVAAGHFREVRRRRWENRGMMAPILCRGVEDAMGSEVHVLLSEVGEDDLTTLTFVMDPELVATAPPCLNI